MLITGLCLYGTPVGVTELILMLRSLTYSEVPVGTTEISKRILVFRSTYLSYRTYTGLTDTRVPLGTTGLVLQNLDMYFKCYTCLTERIFILRILYWYYRTSLDT